MKKIFSNIVKSLEHVAALPVLTGMSGAGGVMITFSTIDDPPSVISWLPSTGWFWAGLVVFALSVVGFIALAVVQARLRKEQARLQKRQDATQAQMVLDAKANMATHLTPVVNGAHRVAISTAETAATTMKERALVALSHILALDDARFCLYLPETTKWGKPTSSNPEDEAVDTLEWDDDPPAGSTRPPRHQVFARSESPVDDANFVVFDEKRSRLISDWRKEAQGDKADEIDCEGASYGGFLVVPIVAGQISKGILTVDVPQAGLLNENHVAIAELAGRLLGVALHRLKVKGASTNPTNPFPAEDTSDDVDPGEEGVDNADKRREDQ